MAGGQLTVSGTGFEPGETVQATLHSTPIDLGTVTADADGAVSLTFTVPADLEPGLHSVDLVGLQLGRDGCPSRSRCSASSCRAGSRPPAGRRTPKPAAGVALVLAGCGARRRWLAARQEACV